MVPDTCTTHTWFNYVKGLVLQRVPSTLFTVTGKKILMEPSLTYGTVRAPWLESSTYKEAETLI